MSRALVIRASGTHLPQISTALMVNELRLLQHTQQLADHVHSHLRRINRGMLRITFAQSESEQRWTLCGQLAGPWVGELRACWDHGCQIARNARRVVDLNDVTFIDQRGEKLLSEMSGHGAEFIAAGVETKHLLESLHVTKNGREK
jgi:hypothetical protein